MTDADNSEDSGADTAAADSTAAETAATESKDDKAVDTEAVDSEAVEADPVDADPVDAEAAEAGAIEDPDELLKQKYREAMAHKHGASGAAKAGHGDTGSFGHSQNTGPTHRMFRRKSGG